MGYIKEQIQLIRDKDPAIKSNWEVFLYPSFRALLTYRITHYLYRKKYFFWARYFSERSKKKTGIEIHPGAVIGKNLFIDHGIGVVIGETAIIGNNVTLFHGVTLGGISDVCGKRHPTVEDNVLIGCYAIILGDITIGEGAKIGAGAVVLNDVLPHTTVVGIPSKIVRTHK